MLEERNEWEFGARNLLLLLEGGLQFCRFLLVLLPEIGRVRFGHLQLAQTDIIVHSFDKDNFQLEVEGFQEMGDVFVDELFLKSDGMGGNDCPFISASCPYHGWDQVSKAFAGARSRFDKGDLTVVICIDDICHHLLLLIARFESFKISGEQPIGLDELKDFFPAARPNGARKEALS